VIALVVNWNSLTHYTWWGVLFHTATLLLRPGARDDVAVQSTIVLGVWAMSAAECTMLTDTHDESGTVTYIAGNFAVHYAPLISALAHTHKSHPRCGPAALMYWLAYVTVVDNPSDVYGCPMHRSIPIVGLACVTTLVSIA